MNPKAQDEALADLPPLAEVRKHRRIRWYRCPIEPAKLRELAEPSDARGLLQATGHLATWAATGTAAWALFTYEIWWGFCIALFLHGTVASFFTAPHHELCHTTVFKTKRLNDFFLIVFSFLGWLNFHVYKFSHSYHHRLHAVPGRGSRGGAAGRAFAAPPLPVAVVHGQRHRWIPVAGLDSHAEELRRNRAEPFRQSLQLLGRGALRRTPGRKEGRRCGGRGACCSCTGP